jgi:hypothetical protein
VKNLLDRKKLHSSRSRRRRRRDSPQFEDAVTNVAVFGQMRCRRRLSRGGHHLVERAAGRKLRIQFPAKLTRPAGARVEAFHYFWIDVFHEVLLPEDVNFSLIEPNRLD